MRRRDLRLRPWLYQIALNVVRNRARRATLPTLSSPEHLNGIASGGEDQPEARVLQSEQAADLEELLSKLPTRYSLAVVLRHVQGLSYAEVAEILDQPVGTTKSDVHRGLRLLRELLEPRLVADTRRS
jgi:RNA polymerase sigma-70 factor (ECF subfamily)